MRRALAQFLRILLQKLEEGSDERDVVTQVEERWNPTTPTPTWQKKNLWRADRASGRSAVLPYRGDKRGHP